MEVSMMRYTQVALCIIVLAMSGVSLVESGRNNEARIPLFKCELTLGITNQKYTDSLLNTGSVDYLILSLEVKGALYSIYGCDSCKTHKFYRGVSAMTFSNQIGTVLVKATLVFQSNETNAHLVESLLMKAINGSNEINNLKFKPEFSEAISGSTPTTNTTTSPFLRFFQMEVSVMRCTWAALCIAVLVMSGSAEGASLVTLTPSNTDTPFMCVLTMDITNRVFNDSLLNPDDLDYKFMYEEVSSVLYDVYGCPFCDTSAFYQGVTDMEFSDMSGSVVVHATLVFYTKKINDMVVKYLFMEAINGRNEINGLEINPEFIEVVPGPSPTPTVVYSTPSPSPTTFQPEETVYVPATTPDSVHIQVNIDPVYDPVYDTVDNPMYDPVYDTVYDTVDNPMYDPVYEPVYDPMYDNVYDPVYDIVYDPVYNTMYDPVYNTVYNPMYDPMYDHVYYPVYKPVDCEEYYHVLPPDVYPKPPTVETVEEEKLEPVSPPETLSPVFLPESVFQPAPACPTESVSPAMTLPQLEPELPPETMSQPDHLSPIENLSQPGPVSPPETLYQVKSVSPPETLSQPNPVGLSETLSPPEPEPQLASDLPPVQADNAAAIDSSPSPPQLTWGEIMDAVVTELEEAEKLKEQEVSKKKDSLKKDKIEEVIEMKEKVEDLAKKKKIEQREEAVDVWKQKTSYSTPNPKGVELFIRGLDSNVDEYPLYKEFLKFGNISRAKVNY
ncbi:hypothetical protein Q7C36_003889 [Tachysurus vachellii]|uniref:SEA domain-containing protein n=1 Tax=Tachysurus vachellii TaxID=175792 RepID=A0AA88T9Q6_TACVA|nr:hypothetical protein Q7C36_003889 [Tachysurus vachellii]